MKVALDQLRGGCVLDVKGPLCAPLDGQLRERVRALLRDGERYILLDLAGVSRIDAAGIGELARQYNQTVALDGTLRIVNATAWVREILQRVGLFDLLDAGSLSGNPW
jgi:anti-anti-sigma factor